MFLFPGTDKVHNELHLMEIYWDLAIPHWELGLETAAYQLEDNFQTIFKHTHLSEAKQMTNSVIHPGMFFLLALFYLSLVLHFLSGLKWSFRYKCQTTIKNQLISFRKTYHLGFKILNQIFLLSFPQWKETFLVCWKIPRYPWKFIPHSHGMMWIGHSNLGMLTFWDLHFGEQINKFLPTNYWKFWKNVIWGVERLRRSKRDKF